MVVRDEQIRRMMDDGMRLAAAGDKKALRILARLKKAAADEDDHALAGFADYYTANYYYNSPRYDCFQKHLKHAIGSLLRSEDKALLARAYNLFALDAMRKGCYDIAQNYYATALRFASEAEDSPVTGIITTNMGNLLQQLGDHEGAHRYYRSGIRAVKRDVDYPFYHRNLLALYINDGLNAIEMNDMALARKTLRAVQRAMRTVEAGQLQDGEILPVFFKAQLTIAEKDYDRVQPLVLELQESLLKEEECYSHMTEICLLTRTLIRHRLFKIAGCFLRAIRDTILASDITYACHQMMELETDYHDAVRNEEAMAESLMKKHHYLLRLRQEQRGVYRHSIDLVRIVGELQEEEQKARAENKQLQISAHTDELTGIPNRYALDRGLGDAFEEALSTQTTLGVGILDINNFKLFNDTYGHQAGDACLVAIGGILKEIAQDERIFCVRYGGDEFLILYRGMTAEEIRAVGARINERSTQTRISVNRHTITRRITIEQGVCNDIPEQKSKPWDFLTEADRTLYRLKHKPDREGRTLVRSLPEHCR